MSNGVVFKKAKQSKLVYSEIYFLTNLLTKEV